MAVIQVDRDSDKHDGHHNAFKHRSVTGEFRSATIGNVGSLTPGDKVYKTGRTTGYTESVANAFPADIEYADEVGVDGTVISHRLIYADMVVSASSALFSQAGDSGSVVCSVIDDYHTAVGLLIGGNRLESGLSPRDITFVSRFDRIIDNLAKKGISLVLPQRDLA